MIFPYIDIPFTSINLYQKPVDSRWGAKKLAAICRTELKREPEIRELFLFYNSPRDTLKLFWRDRNGTQDISRILPRGGFLLPAPKSGEAFVQLDRKILDNLFRVPKLAPSQPQLLSAPTGSPSEIDRQKRLHEAGFIEIDPGQLRSLLNPIRSAPPKPPSRPKTRKTTRKVLPFPSAGRREKSPRQN
jgi:IS66 Orf2 like protein